MMTITPVSHTQSLWGENPFWWKNTLYYVDIKGKKINALTPNQEMSWDVGTQVGEVGCLVPRNKGGFLIAGQRGIFQFAPNWQNPLLSRIDFLANPDYSNPHTRFNDGKCAPDGRFFVGTMSQRRKKGESMLFCVDTEFHITPSLTHITTSNGIVWNNQASLCYYIDTPRRAVSIFDYDSQKGRLSNPRTAFTTHAIDASPDGMAIDTEGRLWIAYCHGGCVACHDPASGKILERIDFPCKETTALCFGGKDNQTLFVTTGRAQNEKAKDAGRVFAIEGLGVRGKAFEPFQG